MIFMILLYFFGFFLFLRLMVLTVMLSEIGRKIKNTPSHLRKESYSLAAGFALGFVTLGMGSEISRLSDLHIEGQKKYFTKLWT